MASVAARWQALAAEAVDRVRSSGPHSLTIGGARERKTLMDRFRAREHRSSGRSSRAAADRDAARARWASVVFVVIASLLLLGGGLLVIERGARRTAGGASSRRSSSATLQGADDEDEAQDLLRRHVERARARRRAVVLRRDASDHQLLAATDAEKVAGLGERLDGAAPRDCLAIRRGRRYERRPSTAAAAAVRDLR